MSVLKLGIIGMSDGNGHPYSWSAIFNGYNKQAMGVCPFPSIPEYLAKQVYPRDFLSHRGKVTHIFTQDILISENIAKASLIDNISSSIDEMLCEVDAVLLARDDGENHLSHSKPIIDSGKHIFIDKPFALNVNDAHEMWSLEKKENQIFSCSSLRFAKELFLTNNDKLILGDIVSFEASVMKKWSTYAVHLIEPVIIQIPNRGKFRGLSKLKKGQLQQTLIEWENLTGYIKTTGSIPTPLEINFVGKKGSVKKQFNDSFSCFKESLQYFIDIIEGYKPNINKKETLEIVEILQSGL